MEKKIPQAADGNSVAAPRKAWEPMRLRYMGHVAQVLQGGGGKLSPMGTDPGEIRKTSSSG